MKPTPFSSIANSMHGNPMRTCVVFALCILLAVFVFGKRNNLEGMVSSSPASLLNPDVEDLKKRTEVMQTAYAQLKNGIQDQTNRIQGNAQMLLKILSDTPNQTNSVTHANVNADDPSKTRIPKIAI
jgi:hypothetical protein